MIDHNAGPLNAFVRILELFNKYDRLSDIKKKKNKCFLSKIKK